MFMVTLHLYSTRGLNHLTIQLLWEVVKRGTVVFLPVSVILDIRGRFLSLKAIIFTVVQKTFYAMILALKVLV